MGSRPEGFTSPKMTSATACPPCAPPLKAADDGQMALEPVLAGEFSLQAGKLADAARWYLQAAQAEVNRERPVGADARVCAPAEVPLNIAAAVTLMDGAKLAGVQARFSAALAEFCRDCALRTDTISFAKALRLLLECEGVADVSGFTLQGGQSSVTLPSRAVAVCGAIVLQEGIA